MARKRIALSQFAVTSDRDDYGVELTHSYRQCDWHAWVEGMSPEQIRRYARAHARACDGQPRPRPKQPAALSAGFFGPALWGPVVEHALSARPVTGAPFVTGLPEL